MVGITGQNTIFELSVEVILNKLSNRTAWGYPTIKRTFLNRIKLMKTPMKKSPKPHDGKKLIIRQKFDKVAKIDKATKGE